MTSPTGPASGRRSYGRRYPRRLLTVGAVIHQENQSFLSRTLQLSEGGMLVAAPALLKAGSEVTVHFALGNEYIHAKAQVIYVFPDLNEHGSYLLGLRFTLLTESELDLIRIFTSYIKDV